MSSAALNHALLRPAVLQILRGVGFHATNQDLLDVITDIAAKFLAYLATRTVIHAMANHNDAAPDITDVRLAMTDCGLLTPAETATEESWKELLRKSLQSVPERNGLRAMESVRRDEEDTAEIGEFAAWFQGPVFKEIRRIAGLQDDESATDALEQHEQAEDYLTVLKKKHSKTGEASRFQGTVLGIASGLKPVKIDGGGPETIKDWVKTIKQQNQQQQQTKAQVQTPHPQSTVNDDTAMTD